MKWNSRGSEAKKPIVGEMRLHSRGKEALMSGTRSKNRRGSEAKIDGHVGKGQSRIAHTDIFTMYTKMIKHIRTYNVHHSLD